MSSRKFELGPKDIVFLVMGPTGAGKSTFINIAFGEDVAEVGHTTTSCTKKPLPIIVDPIPDCPKLEGYRLVLLDTPGFDDTYAQDEEHSKRIAEWLSASRRGGALVGGVLHLHDITAKKCNDTAHRNLPRSSTSTWCNDLKKTLIVTTNWPSCSDAFLEKREQEMKEEHWKTLIDNGLQVWRFQGNYSSAWRVINSLIHRINVSAPSPSSTRRTEINLGPKDIIFPIIGPTGAGKIH
ncbi:hypothetical protein M413DRAFT_193716 [Hebeloma cylindrosporum]|uniref:G domain-containing protein n=1 Tax=Hebeloma cylindrosporum TaxID=76867 RepID=A0A0C2XPS4_HEBCY|nr:hypothetical protein M413DRAFT_193716 [Hebeloma cylindrosporum h7]